MALTLAKETQAYLDKEGFKLEAKSYPREDGTIQRRFVKTEKRNGKDREVAEFWVNEKEATVKKETE